MKFEMWSFWHILYILSPFIIFTLIYFATKKANDKPKYVLGIIIGSISIFIIVIRNLDIFIRNGWDHEVIPLQVCHIGSIIIGLALILKKRWLLLSAFCFNLLPAILAMIFADSLANYDTLLKIRPQTYVWGHIFIVVGALYGILVYKNNFNMKDVKKSLIFIACTLIVAISCNNAFRIWFDWEPNYFYLYNYKGTPLSFLYNALPTSIYGSFQINWFYTLTLIGVFILVYFLLYFSIKQIYKKTK